VPELAEPLAPPRGGLDVGRQHEGRWAGGQELEEPRLASRPDQHARLALARGGVLAEAGVPRAPDRGSRRGRRRQQGQAGRSEAGQALLGDPADQVQLLAADQRLRIDRP
jgi:hypothetical protein